MDIVEEIENMRENYRIDEENFGLGSYIVVHAAGFKGNWTLVCEQMNGLACKAEAVGKRQQVVRPAVIVKFSDRGLFRAKLPKEYIYMCMYIGRRRFTSQ